MKKSKKSTRPSNKQFTLYFKRGTHFQFNHPEHKGHDSTLFTTTVFAKNEKVARSQFTKLNPLTKIVMVREIGKTITPKFNLVTKTKKVFSSQKYSF